MSPTAPKALGGPGGNSANPEQQVPTDAMVTVVAGIGPREELDFDRTVN